MKRAYVLGVIVITGAVVAAAASLAAQQQQPAAGGQGRQGGGGAGGIKSIEKVANNLYFIFGNGGNTGVYIAEKGVVLVDTKLANNGQAILEQVKSVTDKPITHIINTHTHGDHNGSNVFFPAGVEIVVQENTAANMQKMPAFQEAANKHGLADRTYKDRMTLLSGNDSIDLYYYGAAHTNGDTFVVFRNARVMHTGDAFANKGQPFIDRGNGGSGVAYGDTIAKVASNVKNVETIIPGHSPVLFKFQDLVDFGEFNRLFLEHARASLKAGKTPEQAMMDLKLPDKFKDYNLTGGRGGPGGNFGVLFEELKGQ
jgi:glyoxylase-like metal-dependent hydrolase (beta-lactamase superfamily II)